MGRPTPRAFVARFTQSPRATASKSCYLTLLRPHTSTDDTLPAPLNAKQRRLFSAFDGTWAGVDANRCDVWRVSLKDGASVKDLADEMRRLHFHPSCGPHYGTGRVLFVAGSGPEKVNPFNWRKERVKANLENGSLFPLLHSLFGESNFHAVVSQLHEVEIPSFVDSVNIPLELWRKLNAKYSWFGSVYVVWEAYKENIPHTDAMQGDRVLLEWIDRHSKKLPSFAGSEKPKKSYGPIQGNGPEEQRRNERTAKNRAGLDLAPALDYGPCEPRRDCSYAGMQTCFLGLGI